MYALNNALLKKVGDYNVEVYVIDLLAYDAFVFVDLKIYHNGMYAADYLVVREDEKTNSGVRMNSPTIEATLLAVEQDAIKALEDPNAYWR